MSTADYDRFQTELEFASILGMPFMGTGNDPTSANNRNIEPWTMAGDEMGCPPIRSALAWGIRLYPHNHSPAYNFLQDGPMVTVTEDRVTGGPIAPIVVRGESGKRLIRHYLDVTDPDLCLVEMDIYWAHVAQHQWRWRYDWGGQPGRGHLRSGSPRFRRRPFATRCITPRTATGRPEPVGVGDGYTFIPFGDPRSDIDFETFFKNQGAKGYHNPNYEQDNARRSAPTPAGPCGSRPSAPTT